jgi:hypothetical protein
MLRKLMTNCFEGRCGNNTIEDLFIVVIFRSSPLMSPMWKTSTVKKVLEPFVRYGERKICVVITF